MKQPTKIFLAALITAGVVWTGGALNSRRTEQRETELRSKCKAENIADHVNQVLTNSRLFAELTDEEIAVLAKRRGLKVHDLVEQRDNERKKHVSAGVQPFDPYAYASSSDKFNSEHSTKGPTDEVPPAALNAEEIMWNRFICDGEALSRRSDLIGLEADIAKAHQAAASAPKWPTQAAIALVGIGAAPWFWYFLLRRIAELRTAMSGKPPI